MPQADNPFSIFGAMNWRWLFLIPIIWACDDYNDCGISDYSEEMYLSFYSAEDSALLAVQFDSIRLTYADQTRQIIEIIQPESTSNFITVYPLPVDVSDTVMNYHFIAGETRYHLELTYKSEAIIENPECGPIFRLKGVKAQSVEDAESTAFDQVSVQVLELTKLISPHVEVYF